jgi:hypothetical protein
MTDREMALQAQIEAEREQAAQAIEEAYKAGWSDCQRHRLAWTVDSAFLRWVQRRLGDTQRVTYKLEG